MSCDLLTEGSLRSISILNHKSGIFPRHKNMWAIFLPTKDSDFCLVWEVFPNYPLLVTLSLEEYLPSCPNLKQRLAVLFSLNWRHMSIVALGVRGVGKNQGHHTWMTWSWTSFWNLIPDRNLPTFLVNLHSEICIWNHSSGAVF